MNRLRARLALWIMGPKNRQSLVSMLKQVIASQKTHLLDCRGSIAYILLSMKWQEKQ